MLDHIGHCIEVFAADPTKVAAVAFSLSIAGIALIGLSRRGLPLKHKVFLIYAHLSSLLFPLVLFTLTMACGGQCNMTLIEAATYAVTASMLLATLAGFVAVPFMLTRPSRAMPMHDRSAIGFVRRASSKMGVRVPRLYVVESRRPTAFSFRSFISAIFVSAGMRKLLTRKELEAVLLHELAHIRLRSSMFKFSMLLLKFSPFSLVKTFNDELGAEERKADRIVIKMQGTRKHLDAAKAKMKV